MLHFQRQPKAESGSNAIDRSRSVTRPDKRSVPEIALAILATEIYPTEADSPLHPHTFDQYMLDEEERIVGGVSIGPVSRKQKERQIESAITYLMAAPMWAALRELGDGSEQCEPEQHLAMRMHPVILDRMIAAERWFQRDYEKQSAKEEADWKREDLAGVAREYAIAARRFELLKTEFGGLCSKMGIKPMRGPDQGRGA